jgi:predicted RNA-binding protein YlxR (DUF448 family)
MNERTARQRGYTFSGVYKRDPDEVKERIAEERAKGNAAVMVTEKSRGRGNYVRTGYSMYIKLSKKNAWLKRKENLESRMNMKKNDRQKLVAELSKVDGEIEELAAQLSELYVDKAMGV